MVKSQNIEQAIDIQVTSFRKIRIKQNFLLSKYGHFIEKLCVHFEPLLGQESVYVYQNLRIEKEGISGK